MTQEENFFKRHAGIDTVEAFIVDVNGALRGKWVPRRSIKKIFAEGLRLPRSAFAVDIYGNDVPSAGLITETGDNDGICRPVSLKPMPWADPPAAQILMEMPGFFGDPRAILKNILSLYKKAGLTPVVAAELEFYLTDAKPDEKGAPQPPLSPRTGRRATSPQTYGIGETGDFKKVLSDMREACSAQDIPADTTISENGPGQYEITLTHVRDALLAADHAVLLKRAIKGAAQKHGMAATFMAKPYAGKSGSGMHVHLSILDKKGRNIFAGKDKKGAPALRHALAGLMISMADGMAIFASNANSYRRFRKGSHAPTKINWGYDNRAASLRVPDSDIDATRIEHRVAGADANPYLVLAVILAGALEGLRKKTNPPPAVKGNAYAAAGKLLPNTWDIALEAFENSKFIDKHLGRDYKKLYLACKLQEKDILEGQVSSAEHDAYLRDV